MSKQYAKGRNAVAECQRSGQKMRYRDLVEDGHIEGLLVHPDWWEPKHPQEIPVSVTDPVALYRPAPEISIPSGYGDPENLDGGTTPTAPSGSGTLAPFTDDFNRAGPGMGADWAAVPLMDWEAGGGHPLEIAGSAYAQGTQLGNYNAMEYVGGALGPDHYVEIEIVNFVHSSQGTYAWAFVRGDHSTLNGYLAQFFSDGVDLSWDIWRWDTISGGAEIAAGVVAGLGEVPDGSRFRVQAVGNTIGSYFDDVLLGEGTDATYNTQTEVSIGVWPTVALTDIGITNFEAGDISASGTVATAMGVFTDEFDRAGPTLGANWTSPSILNRQVMEIQTVGSAQPGSLITEDWCDGAYTGNPTPPDQFAEVTLQLMDGAEYQRTMGAAVRMTPGTRQTYIGTLSGDDTVDPPKRYFTVEATQAVGAANFLAYGYIDDGPAYAEGTKVHLEISGTYIVFKWKEPGGYWTVLWEGDDGQYSSGYPGMVSYSYIKPPETTQFESFRSGPAQYVQETQIVVSEAITYNIGDWLFIELNDGTYFSSRIASTANAPSFTVPFTSPFTGDAAVGNNFYIEAG